MRRLVALGLALVSCGTSVAYAGEQPLALLHGSALAASTGLRLVVAGAPPYVFDLDGGSITTVPRARVPRGALLVVPFGGKALALGYPLRAGRSALFVSPAGSLAAASAADARAGFATWRRFSMTRQRGDRLTLADHSTGIRRHVRWPSVLSDPDGAVAEPDGPYIALGFGDPAHPGPQQAEDLFLFDRRSGALEHVPGFPAQLDLKHSSVAWTTDGRLVLLVGDASGVRVGVYRPGDRTVALRRADIPVPGGGSDTFVPLVSTG
jgi:hypothetical protein